MGKLNILLITLFFVVSASAVANIKAIPEVRSVKDINKYKEWETKLLGKHLLALQWISWKKFGQVIIKKEGNKLTIQGEQYGGDEENGKDDYLRIKGIIIYVDEDSFIFDGDILTKVYHINDGEECKRSGKKFFQRRGNRKYWRMQDKLNPCEDSPVLDYVDIFFKKI